MTLRRIPVWVLLAALISLSAVVRFVFAVRDPVAWIFPDETVYAELAKAVAFTGDFAIRDTPGTGGLGVVYPLLIAPGFALFDSIADGHDAVKAINSVVMSLTAIPVYLIARRFATPWLALVAAALTVAIPSMAYTGTVMTENAFYPVTATWLLLLIRALERPTAGRQVVMVLAIGVAYVTRAQASTFVPILVTAILIVAVLEHRRRFWVGLWPYRVTGLLLVLGVVGVVVRQLVRGEKVSEVLGAYVALKDYTYGVADVAHWALYHIAELVIMLGVIPFAVFLLVVTMDLTPGVDRERRVFAAVAVSFVAWFAVVVAAFASTELSQRIEERYFFYVAPVFFIALVAWIARGVPRPWWAVWPAVLFTAALPAALPINHFLNEIAVHDTMGLLAVWRWRDRYFSPESIDEIVVGSAVIGALIVLLVPRRWAILLPALLVLYFGAATRPVESFIHRASFGAWEAGARPVEDWVDRAMGIDADVAQVWTGAGSHFAFWESEFYNRSVGPVYALTQPYDSFGQRDARVLMDGHAEFRGRPLRLAYGLTDIWTIMRGEVVATNELTAMHVYRIDGPVVLVQLFQGLYPDRWSGSFAIYRRFACEEGAVARFTADTNPIVHPDAFEVRVLQHGVETQRIDIPPRPLVKTLSVPLRPRDAFCDVFLEIPTESATKATAGDLRQLGLHFTRIEYVPPTTSAR